MPGDVNPLPTNCTEPHITKSCIRFSDTFGATDTTLLEIFNLETADREVRRTLHLCVILREQQLYGQDSELCIFLILATMIQV